MLVLLKAACIILLPKYKKPDQKNKLQSIDLNYTKSQAGPKQQILKLAGRRLKSAGKY